MLNFIQKMHARERERDRENIGKERKNIGRERKRIWGEIGVLFFNEKD